MRVFFRHETMLRISRETDYAVVLLTRLSAGDVAATNGGTAEAEPLLANARDLAETTHLPLPTVSKVLKILARGGLLTSQRGAKGGYSLARPAGDISVAEIIRVVEGPIALTDCVDDDNSDCSHLSDCPVQGNWNRINRAIHDTLESITLLEMAHTDDPNQPTAIYV